MLICSFSVDNGDFERIYNSYVKIMLHCAYSILKDSQLAEDAVQEAFICIIRHIGRLEEGVTDRNINFVYTITRRMAINIYNKRKCTVPYADMEVSCVSNADNFELYAALGRLNVDDRDILLLKYVYGFTQREIAGLFKIRQSAAGLRIKRAKDRLAALLNEKEGR